MKQLFLFLLLFWLYPLQAQNPFPMDSASGTVRYQETIAVPSATVTQLHQKAKNWLTANRKASIRSDRANLLTATFIDTYRESTKSAHRRQVGLSISLTIALTDGQYTCTITAIKVSSSMAGHSTEEWDLEHIANDFLTGADLEAAQGIDKAIRQTIIQPLKTTMMSK